MGHSLKGVKIYWLQIEVTAHMQELVIIIISRLPQEWN